MLHVFADTHNLQRKYFNDAFPLLMPLLAPEWMQDPAKPANPEWLPKIQLVNDADSADILALVLDFSEYQNGEKRQQYLQMAALAEQMQKPLLYFTSGDFGITAPSPHAYGIRLAGHRSIHDGHQIIMPTFFTDPVSNILGTSWYPKPKTEKPVVGFSGKASNSSWVHGKEWAAVAYQNIRRMTGLDPTDKQWLGSASKLRNNILQSLQNSPLLSTQFNLFSQYRAGAKTQEERRASASVYYQNIMESHYVPCVRGTGNFSARLYETMACGRIPVVVDTDIMLPGEPWLPWHDLVLQLAPSDTAQIATLVHKHYNSLGNEAIVQMQQNVRTFWQQNLTYNGFFNLLIDKLPKL